MSFEWTSVMSTVSAVVEDKTLPSRQEVDELLDEAAASHLPPAKAHRLLNALLAQSPEGVGERVMAVSRKVRRQVFGDQVAVMAPVEVSNVCASDCLFCGWRVTNSDMRRLRQGPELVMTQVEYLLDSGVDYIELVGGDDFKFVRDGIPELVPAVRQMMDRKGIDGKICICSMAVTEAHYRRWKELGVDSMFVWQETYDPAAYADQIRSGPKAAGITEDFRLGPAGSGYQFRLESQERAIRAGLEVGIGFMLGLSSPSFECLMLLHHAQHLLSLEEGAGRPLIIGMPTWNNITTPGTDLRRSGGLDAESFFSVFASLIFLCLPKGRVWVFPNCRVSLETQLTAVEAAGAFTSTEVKVGPGGYLPAIIRQRQEKGIPVDALMGQLRSLVGAKGDDLIQLERRLDDSEQFMHHYHRHHEYVEAMRLRGFQVVPSNQLVGTPPA